MRAQNICVASCTPQVAECPVRERLITIDQIEQRHRLAAKRVMPRFGCHSAGGYEFHSAGVIARPYGIEDDVS